MRLERDHMTLSGFFLPDGEFMNHFAVVIGDVDDAQRQKIGGAQHGIKGRVEQSEIADYLFSRQQ